MERYCCEDISKIENYDKAISDDTQVWHCHHRLELVKTGAVVDSTKQDLIDWGLYYNRPADELIFLTGKEHLALHYKGTKRSEETIQRMSDSLKGRASPNKGRKWSDEYKLKQSEAHKGKYPTKETRAKLSRAHKGKKQSDEHIRKRAASRTGKSSSLKGKHWKLVNGERVWY